MSDPCKDSSGDEKFRQFMFKFRLKFRFEFRLKFKFRFRFKLFTNTIMEPYCDTLLWPRDSNKALKRWMRNR